MFVTAEDIRTEMFRLLMRQRHNEETCPILAAHILDLHGLMLTMDTKFTSVVWANQAVR